MTMTHQVTIVAADHPSLDGAVGRFLDELRRASRSSSPSSSANANPFPSLADALSSAGAPDPTAGFRLAALDGARVVGLAQVDPTGQVLVAVVPDRRGEGVGTALARHVLDRSRAIGYTRLCVRSSRRRRAATIPSPST